MAILLVQLVTRSQRRSSAGISNTIALRKLGTRNCPCLNRFLSLKAPPLAAGIFYCGQCQLACTGRTSQSGYSYYWCRGRTDPLRATLGERCIARYIRAQALDMLVWQDLCQVLTQPALITHELQRAQGGEWLPQALQARQRTLREALAQIERQHARW